MSERLSKDKLRQAARLRFIEGASWDEVAKEVGCRRKTLYNWRQKKTWKKVTQEVVSQLKQEAPATAFSCLTREAQSGTVSAAKAILVEVRDGDDSNGEKVDLGEFWWQIMKEQLHGDPVEVINELKADEGEDYGAEQ